MATSTLVQYLETTTNLATGGTTQVGVSPSDRRQFETFLTETAITAGQLVAIDVTAAKLVTDPSGGLSAATVITADFNAAGTVQKIVVGVADQSVTGTATSPQPIRVVVRGPVTYTAIANAGGAGVGVAVGDPLILDLGGTAGQAQVNTAANVLPVWGMAMTAVAAGGGAGKAYVLGLGI